jgi:hypothetical protein
MSHLWLTKFVQLAENPDFGLMTFDEGMRRVVRLTHWRYALRANGLEVGGE